MVGGERHRPKMYPVTCFVVSSVEPKCSAAIQTVVSLLLAS
jgi:hypothetical protein